jgi:hypothetical protein
MTQDELDQQSITQLHSVVLELSKNCFELKKLCATVVGSSLTLLAAFTAQRIDSVFFAGSAVIIVFFWMADAQSYFYQEKIRIYMKTLQGAMLARSPAILIFDGVGMPVSAARQSSPPVQRVFHSIFNWSMTFYFGLLAIDGIAILVYNLGGFHSKPSSHERILQLYRSRWSCNPSLPAANRPAAGGVFVPVH